MMRQRLLAQNVNPKVHKKKVLNTIMLWLPKPQPGPKANSGQWLLASGWSWWITKGKVRAP